MNKRYLYRAKTIETGDLVFGSLVYSPKEDEYYIVEHNDEELSWLVDEKTISQCTGCEDDEGYLIFDGDEVIYEYQGVKTKCIVKFSGGGFCLTENKYYIAPIYQALAFSVKLIDPTYIE